MRVSVITPSFRHLDWLRLCIASVADQVSADNERTSTLEVEHVVQDAGTEGLRGFCAEISGFLLNKYGGEEIKCADSAEIFHYENDQGYRLRVFQEKDDGMYDAINRGFEKSTGDVLMHLNCDEQLLPNALNKATDAFRNDGSVDIFFGDAIVVDARGELLAFRKTVLPSPWTTRVHTLPTLTCATFYKREVVMESGLKFDTKFRSAGDKVWILKAMDLKLKMRLLKVATSTFTLTGDNLMWSEKGREEGRKLFEGLPLLLRKARPFFKILHRFNKWRRGAYQVQPVEYAIYTRINPDERSRFSYQKPNFRYPKL